MQIVKTETFASGRVEIILDEIPDNPREMWDHTGTITSCNSRYLREYVVEQKRAPSNLREITLGIGGLALPCNKRQDGSFSVGSRRSNLDLEGPDCWIYMESEKARKEGFVHPAGPHKGKIDWKRAEACLRAEMDEFGAYCSGDVYGFRVIAVNPLTDEETELHSVWGFYGADSIPYMIEEAKRELPTHDEQREFDLAEAMGA